VKHLVIVINAPSNALHQRKEFIKSFKSKSNVSLICPGAHTLEDEPSLQGVTLIDLPFSRSGTSLFNELTVLFKLKTILKSLQKTDTIIHCFTLKPILYTNLINKVFFKSSLNCFSTFTGLGYLFSAHNSKKLVQKLVSKMLKFCLYKSSHKVIFQNDDDKKNFTSRGIVTSSSHVILGSGVNTKDFPLSVKPAGQPLKFLFIGRLLKDKGVVELIEAFNQIEPSQAAELRIAGDYDFENPQSIDKNHWNSIKSRSNIQHLGFVQDIRPAIDEADVVVLPSYREGLPLSLIQACAMGKAILTTEAPGCKQMVKHNSNGLKVEPESVGDLKDALETFITMSPEKIRAMGLNSRKMAEELFSSKVVNSQIEKLYCSS